MSFSTLLSKAVILEDSDSRKLNGKKVDRGGGLPWLFENYREEANAAVMRQRTVISKQRVSLGKRSFKLPVRV